MPAGVQGSWPGRAEHEAAEVDRVQPVDVLGGVDGQQGLLLVEARRAAGSCTRNALTFGSALKRAMTSSTSAWVAVAGRCSPAEYMPSAAQSSCFMAT